MAVLPNFAQGRDSSEERHLSCAQRAVAFSVTRPVVQRKVVALGVLSILWRSVLPVTTLGLMTMLVINFINGWNDLLHPLSFSLTEAAKTLRVAIPYIYR